MSKLFPSPQRDRKLQPRAEFLDANKEAQLARAWRENGDLAARNRLVTSHHALAIAAARRAGGKGREVDTDILQQAHIGLLKAADRFDPAMGYRFSTYAVWWIRAEIQDYKLQNWSLVRLPNSASGRKLFYNLKRTETRLIASGEVAPEDLDDQIALELAVDKNHVLLMRQRLEGQDASLNRAVGDGDSTFQLQDLLEDPDSDVEATVSARMDGFSFWKDMAAQLKRLSKREQEIIIETYVSDSPKTLAELGDKFGISRERVRQIREAAVSRLRMSFADAL